MHTQLLGLLIGVVVFFSMIFWSSFLPVPKRTAMQRHALTLLAKAFGTYNRVEMGTRVHVTALVLVAFSWTAVIRYHGCPPPRRPNQVSHGHL
jgi:hypothetical protein